MVIVMANIIFHIDVNNAFLSWSAVDLLNKGYKDDIREMDAIIGDETNNRKGIVLAKSNSAKSKGVITGESIYLARKKCPNIKIFPPQYHLYQEMSHKLFDFILKYTPDIEVFSIDECFVDYGKVKKLYGEEEKFAHKLKNEIKNDLGFTVNIGIGNNKLCAKMASDFSKPNQVHTLYENEVKTKLWPLPVELLYGVGKVTAEKLKKINIFTIEDLAKYSPIELSKFFKNQATKMIESANGIDYSNVKTTIEPPKGISHSMTLKYDLITKEEIEIQLKTIAERLSLRLRKLNQYTDVIAVTLKNNNFNVYNHQQKITNPTNITKEIYLIAKKVFNEMWKNDPIRLVGIRLDNLSKKVYYQTSLFEKHDNRKKESNLDTIIDELKRKYGDNIIKSNVNKKDN